MRRALALALCLALLQTGCVWRWIGDGDDEPQASSARSADVPWWQVWRRIGGGDEPREEPPREEGVAADREAVELARRTAEFYPQLANVPLASALTYAQPGLVEYFADRAAFDDYFASLAMQARWANLRYDRIDRVEVRELRLEDVDRAVAKVALLGRHERRLRFWEIELERTDRWRRVDGVWLLTPDRL